MIAYVTVEQQRQHGGQHVLAHAAERVEQAHRLTSDPGVLALQLLQQQVDQLLVLISREREVPEISDVMRRWW